MLQRDSFFLARLVNGRLDLQHDPRALAGLSPTFRPVAARLLAATPSERQPIWDEFLAGKLNIDLMARIRSKHVSNRRWPRKSPRHAPCRSCPGFPTRSPPSRASG